MSSCPYKYVLGIPGQGVHALRLGGVSFNDTWMTVVGAALIAYFGNYSFWITLVGLFVLGEVPLSINVRAPANCRRAYIYTKH